MLRPARKPTTLTQTENRLLVLRLISLPVEEDLDPAHPRLAVDIELGAETVVGAGLAATRGTPGGRPVGNPGDLYVRVPAHCRRRHHQRHPPLPLPPLSAFTFTAFFTVPYCRAPPPVPQAARVMVSLISVTAPLRASSRPLHGDATVQ